MPHVNFAANSLRLRAIFCGNVRLPKEVQQRSRWFFLTLPADEKYKLSKLELERWTVTAWAIWNARNKFYFQQIQTHPRVILEGANGLLVSTSDGSTVPSSMRYRSAVSSVYVVSVFLFLFFLVYVGSTAALYLLVFPPSQSFGSVSLDLLVLISILIKFFLSFLLNK